MNVPLFQTIILGFLFYTLGLITRAFIDHEKAPLFLFLFFLMAMEGGMLTCLYFLP